MLHSIIKNSRLASLALAGLLSLVPAGCRPAVAPDGPAASERPAAVSLATVIFTRHGEKAADDPRDPGLSPAGEARAQALAALLASAGVTHLFASELRRTQATLGPLARATGLGVTTFPAGAPDELLAALRALPAGAIAVVAGHSNTLPNLIEALGGQVRDTAEAGGQRVLADDAYDRLFVVTLPRAPATGEVQTLELRYGASAP
jgi:phosphohistidine phosphatase SixA